MDVEMAKKKREINPSHDASFAVEINPNSTVS